jgi:hypothetical protein
VFSARYAQTRFLVRDPAFAQRYQQLTVVPAPREQYHYFVFARRAGVPRLRSGPSLPAPPSAHGLAAMVDALFASVRRR